MNLIPQRFHSLFNKNSPLPYIIILGIFFLVASCSTKGPDSPLKPYPDQTGKRENSRDWDFNYRKDRLYPKEQETAKGQDLESFSGPATLDELVGFADDLDRASLEKAIMNQLQAMFRKDGRHQVTVVFSDSAAASQNRAAYHQVPTASRTNRK